MVFLWNDGGKFDVYICCVLQQQSRLVLFFVFFFFFFFLSQLVAKLNVLVRAMTHQQPEVLSRDRANFSFTSLSIANVLVNTAANVAGLWCWLGVSLGMVPLLVLLSLMANRQPWQKCLALEPCHNLHCIHVRSYWCLFWVCLCPWVCHWLFRGFEPWLIG